jgi:SAM-dependent methyltransferase
MRREVLHILCCPNCKCDLTLIEKQVVDNEVIDGTLQCNNCQKSFVITKGVPRMVVELDDREELAESWSYEWTKQAEGKLEIDTIYGETEEQEVDNLFQCLGINPDDLLGSVVLDAGCGFGRLTKALGKYGAEVFGIDIADSIEHTYQYCNTNKNVHMIQADIVNLPFKKGSFDYVWSKLAICYVHNPEHAFKNLSDLVKPSGKLFISVPDKANVSFVVKFRDFLRIPHRIPRVLLFYSSWCLAPLLALTKKALRKPKTSLRANAFFLFNAMHPSFMTRHTREEVINWFEAGRFHDITHIDGIKYVIPVRGTKK